MGENTREERRHRNPLASRNKLTVSGLKDTDEYVYRWVNDVDGRCLECWEMGYDFVDRDGKVVGDGSFESAKGVGTALSKGVGQGVTAFLMKIPRDVFNENRKVRVDKPTDDLESGMFPKELTGPGTYGSVKITK